VPEMTTELLRLYGKMVDNQADQITLAGEQVRVISELNKNMETLNKHLSNGVFKEVKEQNKETRKRINSIYVVLVGLLVPLILAILKYAEHLKELKDIICG